MLLLMNCDSAVFNNEKRENTYNFGSGSGWKQLHSAPIGFTGATILCLFSSMCLLPDGLSWPIWREILSKSLSVVSGGKCSAVEGDSLQVRSRHGFYEADAGRIQGGIRL